jgi:hypothetical protein
MQATEFYDQINARVIGWQISLDMAPYADTLEARYNAVREAMTDAEIAAVAAILEGQA